MPEPLSPSVGWGVLHLFCKPSPAVDAAAVLAAVKALQADDHQVVTAVLLGHKADACFMALGPDLWRLRRFQTELVGAGFEVVDSFVSLTELSEYSEHLPDAMKEARLHPQLPPEGKPAFCFYPMSKRRQVQQNWFTLPYDDRKDLMMAHGKSGRAFAGRVLQVVTGATGVDDWEWGVTLFAQHPDDLKEVVYTMRFDEASAIYADFGQFVTGMVSTPDELLTELGVRPSS
ncbi:MAG: chlorite dismutase family protein [Actinomycetota bacterium]|nr:chlorite dismutase family protein [Actinomycetota bacterium]